jgi:putative ATPase
LGENNFLEQEYLPDNIKNTALYQPQKNTREQEIKKFLSERWKGKYGY